MRPSRLIVPKVLLIFAAAALQPALAADTIHIGYASNLNSITQPPTISTLNFDGLPDSTLVSNQFPGLTFAGAIILTSGISLNEFEFPPRSGANILSDNAGPITIQFSAPITTFSAYFTYRSRVTLRALDGSGNTLATTQSAFTNNMALSGVAGSAPNERVQVSSATTAISRVIITADPLGASFAMDDATLTTAAPPSTNGDPVVNITNNGANGAPLSGPGFGAAAGNMCVNVYAFSPDEQLISCCSCLVTPNGLVSLSVTNDLISNTLTGIRPSSVVIKLLATGTGGAAGIPVFSGTSCTNSAAIAGSAALPAVDGLHAWGTTSHASPTGGSAVTEIQFLRATLSGAEQASLTNRCSNILGNGSTFGVCRSCRIGGLGGERK